MSPARRLQVVGVTVVGAFAAMSLTRVIWPDPVGSGPPSHLLPFFVVLSAVEGLAFGLGLSLLVFGPGYLRRTGVSRLGWASWAALVWLLVSWAPHDSLHRVLPHGDWAGLLRIEFGFHVTLIVAGAVVAAEFLSLLSAVPAPVAETAGSRR